MLIKNLQVQFPLKILWYCFLEQEILIVFHQLLNGDLRGKTRVHARTHNTQKHTLHSHITTEYFLKSSLFESDRARLEHLSSARHPHVGTLDSNSCHKLCFFCVFEQMCICSVSAFVCAFVCGHAHMCCVSA